MILFFLYINGFLLWMCSGINDRVLFFSFSHENKMCNSMVLTEKFEKLYSYWQNKQSRMNFAPEEAGSFARALQIDEGSACGTAGDLTRWGGI